jgi:hypothetical protein
MAATAAPAASALRFHQPEQIAMFSKVILPKFPCRAWLLPVNAQAREQLLAHSSAADRLQLDLKARDDEKAALELLLAKEKEAAAGRVRKAEADAAALNEERAKRQRLQDENKVGWLAGWLISCWCAFACGLWAAVLMLTLSPAPAVLSAE